MSDPPGSLSVALQRFLRAVTGGSSGSATSARDVTAPQDDFDFGFEEPRRDARGVPFVRSSGRLTRAMAVVLSIVVVVFALRQIGARSEAPPVVPAIVDQPAVPPEPTPDISSGPGFRNYAIETTELEGLPVDAAPGTQFELWATWEPPLTKRIKVQRLIRTVRLEKVVPPVVPEAPPTAVLSVPAGNIPDLLYGDRFGELSVSILPTP